MQLVGDSESLLSCHKTVLLIPRKVFFDPTEGFLGEHSFEVVLREDREPANISEGVVGKTVAIDVLDNLCEPFDGNCLAWLDLLRLGQILLVGYLGKGVSPLIVSHLDLFLLLITF